MAAKSIEGQITFAEYLAGLSAQMAPPEPPRAPRTAATRAGGPDLSESVRRVLLAGAGRPGARLRIERSIVEHPGWCYEPIRTAVQELNGVKAGPVEIHRRGIWDRGSGWYTWPNVVAWIGAQIKAGTWLTGTERATEESTDMERAAVPRGWKI